MGLSQLVSIGRGLMYVHYCNNTKGLVDNFMIARDFHK